MKRLLHLIRKELIELRRDPRLFSIVIIAPIVQLTLLAYAATTDVRDVPVVVVDEDQSTESRALDQPLRRVAELHRRGRGGRRRASWRRHSTTRRAWMALTIPPRLRRPAARRRRPRRCRSWPTAPTPTRPTWRWATPASLIAGYAAELAAAAGRRRARPLVSAEVRVWFNPQLESRFFMIPGIARPAAAGGDHQPVVDGDRAGAGDGHARAVERHADRPLGADRRQAPALCASSACVDVAARAAGVDLLVRGAAARQPGAAVGDVRRLPAEHARSRALRLHDLAARSSRR